MDQARQPARRLIQLAFVGVALAMLPITATAQVPRPVQWESAPRASGSFGTVYRGTDGQGRPVAGKSMRDHASAAREAEILTRLRGYEGFPQFHEVWHHNASQHTLVMDWVEGSSVHKWTPRTVDKSARIVSRLLQHLEELHRRGFLHQDVKPDNTRINDRGDSGSLKLLDFGQAVEHGQRWTAESGTAEFRAPEQDHAGVRTPATDVYGAASYFLYLMNGTYPFPAARALAKAQNWNALLAHRAERAAIGLVADPGLRAILWKALSPNPAERYQSAVDFRHALAPYTKAN